MHLTESSTVNRTSTALFVEVSPVTQAADSYTDKQVSVFIDRPSTWVKFKRDSQCEGCFAGCCTLPVEASASDLVRLEVMTEDEAAGSLKKVFRRLHKAGVARSFHPTTGFFILEQRNGRDCIFLHPTTRRCTVYEKRPETCRNFPKIGPRPGFCPEKKTSPRK